MDASSADPGKKADTGSHGPKPRRRYLTTPKVQERYGVSDRTIENWMADPTLEFPHPTYVYNRRYFAEDELEEWERGRASREP